MLHLRYPEPFPESLQSLWSGTLDFYSFQIFCKEVIHHTHRANVNHVWCRTSGWKHFMWCEYCAGPSSALTCPDVDSTIALKVCCPFWHSDISSRSCKSYKSQGWRSMKFDVIDLRNLKTPQTQDALSCWKGTQCRKYHFPLRVCIVCSNVYS